MSTPTARLTCADSGEGYGPSKELNTDDGGLSATRGQSGLQAGPPPSDPTTSAENTCEDNPMVAGSGAPHDPDTPEQDTLIRQGERPMLIPRWLVRDDSLSFTARGLICFLIAVDEPRSYIDLCAETPTEEHDAIADALDELLGAGLIAQVSQEQFAVHYGDKGADL